MKLKFKKLTTVDYADHRLNEIVGQTFQHGEVVEVVAIEDNVSGYVNLCFDNNDLAIGVPKNTFDIL